LRDILKPFWAAKEMAEESEMRTHSSKAAIKSKARNPKHEANSNDQNPNVQNKSRAKILIQIVVALLALAVCLSACAGKSASSKFYVLSPLPQSKQSGVDGTAIGVFPVAMADYLDRPQIVTRVSENEINLDEFSRWAEPLKENFYTVLVDNLSTLLNSERIIKTAQRLSVPQAMQVGVEVLQFDGVLGGDVVLSVKWALFEAEGKKLLLAKRSSFREPTGAATYEALVAAESRTVAALSREIAEAIRARK
jgi:uncharacterized lipoprotein YmbA